MSTRRVITELFYTFFVKKVQLLLVIMVLCYTAGSKSSIAEIITTPPVNTVGCLGSVSSFYCDSNRTDVIVMHWTIDGNTLSSSVKEERGITIINDTQLDITAKLTNDDIAVGCNIVTSSPPYTESAGAIFTVSNIPPVVDLNITIDNNTLTGTWSEPDCLPINYTYLYTVNVSNQTIITGNTTETMFITLLTSMIPHHLCTTYTVSVVVMTQNHSSDFTSKSQVPYDFQVLDQHEVVFKNDLTCYIEVPYEVKLHKNSEKLGCSILIKTNVTSTKPPKEYDISTDSSVDLTVPTGNFLLNDISKRFDGTVRVVLAATEEIVAVMNISTYNLQNLTVDTLSEQGLVKVACVFATGSRAYGCVVKCVCKNQSCDYYTKWTNQQSAALYFSLQNGVYDIYGYDRLNPNDTIMNEDELEAFKIDDYTVNFTVSSVTSSVVAIVSSKSAFVISSSPSIEELYSSTQPFIIKYTISSMVYTPTVMPNSVGALVILVPVVMMTLVLLIFTILFLLIYMYVTRVKHRQKRSKLHQEQVLVYKSRADSHDYQPVQQISLSKQLSTTTTTQEDMENRFDYLTYPCPEEPSVEVRLTTESDRDARPSGYGFSHTVPEENSTTKPIVYSDILIARGNRPAATPSEKSVLYSDLLQARVIKQEENDLCHDICDIHVPEEKNGSEMCVTNRFTITTHEAGPTDCNRVDIPTFFKQTESGYESSTAKNSCSRFVNIIENEIPFKNCTCSKSKYTTNQHFTQDLTHSHFLTDQNLTVQAYISENEQDKVNPLRIFSISATIIVVLVVMCMALATYMYMYKLDTQMDYVALPVFTPAIKYIGFNAIALLSAIFCVSMAFLLRQTVSIFKNIAGVLSSFMMSRSVEVENTWKKQEQNSSLPGTVC